MQQQCLPLHLEDQPSFSNFYCSSPYTSALISHLKNHNQQGQPLIIYGDSGCGKSHLLKAACLRSQRLWIYLPGKTLHRFNPDLLHNLQQHLLCIDDIQHLLGNPTWEHSLFHALTNHTKNHVLFSYSNSNTLEKCQLQDLRSRLQAMLHLQLQPLNESEQIQALAHRAQHKGLSLSTQCAVWMLQHTPRNNHSLFKLLTQLDQHCLKTKRKPTISILKDLVEQCSATV